MKTTTLFFVVILFIITNVVTLVTSTLYKRITWQNYGHIKQINCTVYWDSSLTIPVTEINWGYLEPGENATQTFYAQATGQFAQVNLAVYSERWVPETAIQFLTFTPTITMLIEGVWLVNGTLTVSMNITKITSFAFDIICEVTG